MPDWKTRHSTKLFAEKVMPHLRNLWPEWEHDDRWWIHPMEDRLHPEETQPGAEKPGRRGGMKRGTRIRGLRSTP